jgi:hypothetical protein
MLSTPSSGWRVPYLGPSVPQPGRYDSLPHYQPREDVRSSAPEPVEPLSGPTSQQLQPITGISRIDSFITNHTNGFQPSTLTLLDGQTDFLFLLVAQIIVKAIQNFDRDVVFVDGGNSFDIYGLTACCRRFRIDPEHVLKRVKIARAFTVYQLDTLLTRNLERSVRELRPKLVVGACISSLFMDKDVNWTEAKMIMKNDFKTLHKVTADHNLIMLITKYGHHRSLHRFELNSILRANLSPSNIIGLKTVSRHKLQFVTGTGRFMEYYPLPPYQLSLDEFCDGGDIYR